MILTLQQDTTYMAVSETSDDMYAAIEDPRWVICINDENAQTAPFRNGKKWP